MLTVHNVSKSFGPAQVLSGVDLRVAGGTIHALLGANGAGKSTLMKCIAGAVTPDTGSITIGSREHSSLTPLHSAQLGVASVFQHLSLVATLTVAENIFLGAEYTSFGFVDTRTQKRKAREVLATLGEDIDPSMRVEDLPADRRQMVEIAKAIAKAPKVLILDEPTAALSQLETERLFSVVRDLKRSGIAIIYISHRIPEIFEIADTLSVLRDGKVVMQGDVAGATLEEIIAAIVGTRDEASLRQARESTDGDVIMSAVGLDCGLAEAVSLDIRKGETVGLYGLKGNGRHAVVAALAGAVRASGKIIVNGAPCRFTGPADAIANGICLVPGDRLKRGLFPTMASFDNVLLPHLSRLGRGMLRSRGKEREVFKNVVRALGVMPPDPAVTTRNLSGGNQQKLLLGRWTSRPSGLNVLLLEEPTEGVDVRARRHLYANLRSAVVEHGFGILWSSSDLDELVEMADRVLVMAGGRIVREFSGRQITSQAILAAAQGS